MKTPETITIDALQLDVTVCITSKQFLKIAKLNNMEIQARSHLNSAAAVMLFKNNGYHFITHYNVQKWRKENYSIFDQIGLVAHETSHIIFNLWNMMGESSPGDEASAYLSQYLVDKQTQILFPDLKS